MIAICVVILCGILTAGLWPFNPFPRNEVSWNTGEQGLRFGDYGTVLSSQDFRLNGTQGPGPCSLEIFLQPGATYDSNVILAFSTDDNPLQFRIRQDGDMVSVLRDVLAARRQVDTSAVHVEHAFREGRDVLITVTSDGQATSVYLNGQLAEGAAHFGLTDGDFTGEMILGNSPVRYDTWSGVLKGLVLFSRQLTGTRVAQHYDEWLHDGRIELRGDEGVFALYSFNEGAGQVIRDRIGSSPDLYIPKYFVTLHQAFLMPPWKEYSPDWGFWKGALKNIIGFIPLGFFFRAAFSLKFDSRRASFATIVVGGFVSLTIEVAQAYLPMHDSGMTDIITNTFGTAIGVMLYGSKVFQILPATLGILVEPQDKAFPE